VDEVEIVATMNDSLLPVLYIFVSYYCLYDGGRRAKDDDDGYGLYDADTKERRNEHQSINIGCQAKLYEIMNKVRIFASGVMSKLYERYRRR
jgi:hypothetical protein